MRPLSLVSQGVTPAPKQARSKSSKFQRTAYARQASRLAEELLEWSKIYSRRSYVAAWTRGEALEKERDEERADELAELGMGLQRIAMRIMAL